MTKESIYELQKIDCNCNDCTFLFRWLEKQNIVVANDKIEQEETFNYVKQKKIVECLEDISNLDKNKTLIRNVEEKIKGKQVYLQELKNRTFHYRGQQNPIQYGICCKFKKAITFIPNTLQLETQDCFIHRKDAKPL